MKLTQAEKLLLLTMLRDKTDNIQVGVKEARRLLDTPTLSSATRLTVAKNLENLESHLKVSEGVLYKVMRTPALG